MVKIFIGGLLAAEGVNAGASYINADGAPATPFLRQDPDCCDRLKISNSGTDADGVYFKGAEEGGTGRAEYWRADGAYVCHHEDKAWMCATFDIFSAGDYMKGSVGVVTNTACIIDKKVADPKTDRWQTSQQWDGPAFPHKFQIDTNVRIECIGAIDECLNDDAHHCPANSECSNTDGGYTCNCAQDEICDDWDQCADNGGATCTDATCIEADTGYECECEDGYTYNYSKNKCEDFDECQDAQDRGEDMCESVDHASCNNIEATFECVCDGGYIDDGNDGCRDRNECDDEDFCKDKMSNAQCVNDIGTGAHCECAEGFIENEDDNTQCDDVKECDADVSPCDANQNCVELAPSFECECKDGYDDKSNSGVCSDIDECAGEREVCLEDHQTCQNSVGGHQCGCEEGWEVDSDTGLCKDKDECDQWDDLTGYVDPCQSHAKCDNTDGTFTCSCKTGFEELTAGVCTDINECTDEDYLKTCDGEYSKCVNSDGTAACECLHGYQVKDVDSPEGDCVETKECETTTCGANMRKVEEIGRCDCVCEDGWDMDADTNECVDHDECKSGKTVCSGDNEECSNDNDENPQIGPGDQAQCLCKAGYERNDDGACVDINECLNEDTPYCTTENTRCVNSPGRAGCACKPGYTSKAGGSGCEDKNECELGTHACKANSHCVNEKPSFRCDCDSGFDDAGEASAPCDNIDDCTPDTCDANQNCVDLVEDTRCDCKAGWAKDPENPQDDACYDVNQCENNEVTCDGLNQECFNGSGNDGCVCEDGWLADMTMGPDDTEYVLKCTIDRDECEEDDHTCGDETHDHCENIDGSFECKCNDGYDFDEDEQACKNVNECDGGHKCEKANTVCVDNDGGVGCACKAGYREVEQVCVDRDECDADVGLNDDKDKACDFAHSTCDNEDTSYKCGCEDGWTLNEDGTGCNDVNECDNDTHDCLDNEYCENGTGDHACHCKPGWEGEAGSCTDVDECAIVCEEAEECTDPDGCPEPPACNKVECDSDKHLECANETPGETAYCKCMDGWEMDEGVCVDTNECDRGTVTCGDNQECVNGENGASATCECEAGYKASDDEDVTGCVDKNECADEEHECHALASCHNNAGGYTCKCPGEYQGDGKNCIMCPSEECWTYDADNMKCTPKEHCSSLVCGAEGFEISMMIELFGLNAGQAVNWGGEASPECDDSDCAIKSDFGTDGMTYTMGESTITWSMMISLTGNNRHRSDSVDHDQVDLGDRQIIINPFGVGMLFQCTYPRLVTLSSQAYTVEDVSISSSMQGDGQWTESFTMVLNNGDGVEFILGQVLPVEVSWAVNHAKLTFYYDSCSVTHGLTVINVIKGGCYAGATKTGPTVDEQFKNAFEFTIFKGVNEVATTQTIECSVMICELGDCGKPTSNDDCPADGAHDSFYKYTFDGSF